MSNQKPESGTCASEHSKGCSECRPDATQLRGLTPTDVELMKALAQTVAEETVKKLREEIRQGIKDTVATEVKQAFGEMSPIEHAIQHRRFNDFLNWTDNISKTFWGGLIGGFAKWVGGIFLLGYFVWHQTGGKVG